MENLLQDLKYALRTLRKSPGFTLVAVLTLALGIGANTALFSVVNGVLLQSLPYGQGDRLVVVRQAAEGAKVENLYFSVQEIQDLRERSQTLDQVVEFHDMEFTLVGRGQPQQVHTGVVSANFFDVLGVRPYLGRTFQPGEDQPGTAPIMVLSYDYWQKAFGGDPTVIGEAFELTGEMHTVVGVLPPIPQYPVDVDVYMPVSHCPTRSSERFIANRQARMMEVFARLKPGLTLQQAAGDVERIALSFHRDYPDIYQTNLRHSMAAAALKRELTKQARAPFLMLLFASGFVLLIACANVANLVLSRLVRRQQEWAVRAALGASKGRLIRQLLTESVLLSLTGGVVAVLMATWGLDLLVAFAARFTARAQEVSMDGTVLLYTLLISLATGVFFGVAPALRSARDVSPALGDGSSRSTTGTGAQRLRNILVAAQVAVSVVLLIGAGLMLRSLMKLRQVDAGFNSHNVISMRVALNYRAFERKPENRMAFFRRLLERVEAMPEVTSAGVGGALPLTRTHGHGQTFQIEGRTVVPGDELPAAEVNVASPQYFSTLGIPLLRGRFFSAADDDSAGHRSLIINASLAKRYFDGDDAVGRQISLSYENEPRTIVGVVGDTRQFGLDRKAAEEIYVPFWGGNFAARLVVRTASDPTLVAGSVTRAIREIAPQQTVDNVLTLEEIRADSLAPSRRTTILIAIFGGLALVIAGAGISSVVALSVSQRTHEFGIRMALGAKAGDILRLVVGQAMRLVVAGAAVGVVVALSVVRLLTTFLYGVQPTDPLTFAAIVLLLGMVALAACYWPARRATRVDPMIALRYE